MSDECVFFLKEYYEFYVFGVNLLNGSVWDETSCVSVWTWQSKVKYSKQGIFYFQAKIKYECEESPGFQPDFIFHLLNPKEIRTSVQDEDLALDNNLW